MIVTDAELNQLDEGIELIVRTEKDVLDRSEERRVGKECSQV